MGKRWLRWAWILPVGELVLAFFVAGIPAIQMLKLGWSHPLQHAIAPDGRIIIKIPPEVEKVWMPDETHKQFPDRFENISYLNLPAILVEIGISLPTTWPDSWYPHWAWLIGLDGFRALSWPIFALPFWIFSGRGMDALYGDDSKITTFEAFTMGLLSVAIATATVGIAVCVPPDRDDAYMRWELVPFTMWVGLGIICQMAWWRQRRNRRMQVIETLATSE